MIFKHEYNETINGRNYTRILTATFKLHHIRGNKHPHFSVTGEDRRKGAMHANMCGCIHDAILKVFPSLVDAVALHLCDDDGTPMYALENGFYYCSHKEGRKLEYSSQTVADHFRIPLKQVPSIRRMTKEELAAWIETQKPRWKQEAEAVITKYSLTVEHS